jgi:hypothetical protein
MIFLYHLSVPRLRWPAPLVHLALIYFGLAEGFRQCGMVSSGARWTIQSYYADIRFSLSADYAEDTEASLDDIPRIIDNTGKT